MTRRYKKRSKRLADDAVKMMRRKLDAHDTYDTSAHAPGLCEQCGTSEGVETVSQRGWVRRVCGGCVK